MTTLRHLSPLLAVLVLTACMSAEAQIKQEIAEANYCDTADDCEDAGGKCPFDCFVFVNKSEVDRIKTLVDDFESQCVYSCVALNRVDCIDHQCKPVFDAPVVQNPQPEGNAGERCTIDEDCVTPMDYLIRSSCPFTSLCMEGKCAVVCPMASINLDPPIKQGEPAVCKADSDCDCGNFVTSGQGRCACDEGRCVAVVKE